MPFTGYWSYTEQNCNMTNKTQIVLHDDFNLNNIINADFHEVEKPYTDFKLGAVGATGL